MTTTIYEKLGWRDIARIASGGLLQLSDAAWHRVDAARGVVEGLVDRGARAYGITTGVGALSDIVVDKGRHSALSRSIVLSHACGVGPALEARETRAIIAAQVANFAHGYSGVRKLVVEHLVHLLNTNCLPEMPSKGSAGYLTHNAHTALVLIGEGRAVVKGSRVAGAQALDDVGLEPLVLVAKEGLSLVNATSCSTGLMSVAVARAEHLLEWADAISALTLEATGCQMAAFDEKVLALRPSAGIQTVGMNLRTRLSDSELVAKAAGRRTQDALSLRAIPHAHGATRDVADQTGRIVDQELSSVTDNPLVAGTRDNPEVWSEAHAVAPALGQAADSLAIAIAQVAAMSERRIDRLINPLVSGLPAFLASDAGSNSGFMIGQYTAASLVNDSRRLAAPASLDGGLTSAMQEDFLAHPTAAANKLLTILDNAEYIFAIELMAAAQAHDFLTPVARRAPGTDMLFNFARRYVSHYRDQAPLHLDIETLRDAIRSQPAP